jgi:hypothetical protein
MKFLFSLFLLSVFLLLSHLVFLVPKDILFWFVRERLTFIEGCGLFLPQFLLLYTCAFLLVIRVREAKREVH